MTIHLVMCRSCGSFVHAVPRDETLVPLTDHCPDCGGTEFKDNQTGDLITRD